MKTKISTSKKRAWLIALVILIMGIYFVSTNKPLYASIAFTSAGLIGLFSIYPEIVKAFKK